MATKEPARIVNVLMEENKVLRNVLSHKSIVQKARERFAAYDSRQWEKTSFYPSGGFLVTELDRKLYAQKSNKERQVFNKEQRMANNFASFGFQIEHLFEPRGEKRPDAMVIRHASSKIKVNGLLADFKSLNNSNNIRREAKDAVSKGAKLVMFEFKARDTKGIHNELRKLTDKGIHGFFYFQGENKFYAF